MPKLRDICTRPWLNGQSVDVLGSPDAANRVAVRIVQTGECIRVRPACVASDGEQSPTAEEESGESEETCPVCIDRSPAATLTCGHKVCHDCYKRLAQSLEASRRSFQHELDMNPAADMIAPKCPLCRSLITLYTHEPTPQTFLWDGAPPIGWDPGCIPSAMNLFMLGGPYSVQQLHIGIGGSDFSAFTEEIFVLTYSNVMSRTSAGQQCLRRAEDELSRMREALAMHSRGSNEESSEADAQLIGAARDVFGRLLDSLALSIEIWVGHASNCDDDCGLLTLPEAAPLHLLLERATKDKIRNAASAWWRTISPPWIMGLSVYQVPPELLRQNPRGSTVQEYALRNLRRRGVDVE